MTETSLSDLTPQTESKLWQRGRLAMAALVAAVFLQGCGILGGSKESAQDPDSVEVNEGPIAFDVEVHSDRDSSRIADSLENYLEIQRYRRFPDLRENEFNRLLVEADKNARDLLAALGYFNPELTLTVRTNEIGSKAPRTIVVDVTTGPLTTVKSHNIGFSEPMASYPDAQRQRQRIVRGWSLQDGEPFVSSDWNSAKNAGLRELQKYRYPTAQIAKSQALVDADTNQADLSVHYDPGPEYRFGEVELIGVKRYDPQGIKNIARIPSGAVYSEEELLDAQQRLASSGYFDSAFLLLDTENSDPEAAKVVAQLREAQFQKVVFGLGFSTDAGPRLSIDHSHNRIWPLDWRSVTNLKLDSKEQELTSTITAMPKEDGWAWFTGGSLKREDTGDVKTNSLGLRLGQTKSVGHIDRSYYLKYDFSKALGDSDVSGSASSLMAGYEWTGSYFNNKINPTSGYGLSAELGAGFTLTPSREPFVRTRLRAMQFIPFGQRNNVGRRNRILVRGDVGAVFADNNVRVPASLLFLTGGDTTIRGYSFDSIGARTDDGTLYAGRYMAVASAEWLRPVTLFGNATDWGHAVFVDTGAVTDEAKNVRIYTGVGTGLRWSSPVGPMQVDVAYGVKTQQLRLHMRLGFTF
ncbi:autotransporter assembly complex protein TamA [Lampropedia aestuarii]|uniref:autotransporter assembly complex protein TamA n=1 Tax=Lampropedia aestuarii TaxID=2562762 RepID=UPI00246827C4|nr:BamA/TamA family outer membrane protein [Lampropedia aestuarii]MDH5857955.1 BamA/TamA family outer membrane protein [Lampropedia aestuarii]